MYSRDLLFLTEMQTPLRPKLMIRDEKPTPMITPMTGKGKEYQQAGPQESHKVALRTTAETKGEEQEHVVGL